MLFSSLSQSINKKEDHRQANRPVTAAKSQGNDLVYPNNYKDNGKRKKNDVGEFSHVN
jgi:hypothetical protein